MGNIGLVARKVGLCYMKVGDFFTNLSEEPSVCAKDNISPAGSGRRAAPSRGRRERSERRPGAPGRPALIKGAPARRNPVLPFRQTWSNPKSEEGQAGRIKCNP